MALCEICGEDEYKSKLEGICIMSGSSEYTTYLRGHSECMQPVKDHLSRDGFDNDKYFRDKCNICEGKVGKTNRFGDKISPYSIKINNIWYSLCEEHLQKAKKILNKYKKDDLKNQKAEQLFKYHR